VPFPFSVLKPASLAGASPTRITVARMRAVLLAGKIGWWQNPEQRTLRQAGVLMACAEAPCLAAHEAATGFALFRAVLCLGQAVSLEPEAASQRERSRFLPRLGLT